MLDPMTWNDGKSYSINGGARCYKTRHSWAKAALRQYGNKCERCGWAKARCDVHHRNAKARGGLHTTMPADRRNRDKAPVAMPSEVAMPAERMPCR